MKTIARRVDAALFAPGTGRHLWYVHTAFAAILACRLALSPYREYAKQPDGLFRAVWFLPFFDGAPSATAIIAVQIVGVVCAAAFVASRARPELLPHRWARSAYFVAWVAYLLLSALRASNGKVMHNDVTGLWCTFFFCFAPLDARRDDHTSSRRYGWPVTASIAFMACAYFFAGWWKIIRTGPAWVLSDNVRLSMAWGPEPSGPRWDALADFLTRYASLGMAVAAVTIIFELVSPVAIFAPRTRPYVGAVAIGLHVGVYLIFALDYWMWIAVDAIVMFDPTTRPLFGRARSSAGDLAPSTTG